MILTTALADYLVANVSGLTRWDESTRNGNVRTDSIDPNLNGLQVVVFSASPGASNEIDVVYEHNLTIEVLSNNEDEAFQMARDIYKKLSESPSFSTTGIDFKYTALAGDVIRRGLFKPEIINYGIELSITYVEK